MDCLPNMRGQILLASRDCEVLVSTQEMFVLPVLGCEVPALEGSGSSWRNPGTERCDMSLPGFS